MAFGFLVFFRLLQAIDERFEFVEIGLHFDRFLRRFGFGLSRRTALARYLCIFRLTFLFRDLILILFFFVIDSV